MIIELNQQTLVTEFDSHWVSHTSVSVTKLSLVNDYGTLYSVMVSKPLSV